MKLNSISPIHDAAQQHLFLSLNFKEWGRILKDTIMWPKISSQLSAAVRKVVNNYVQLKVWLNCLPVGGICHGQSCWVLNWLWICQRKKRALKQKLKFWDWLDFLQTMNRQIYRRRKRSKIKWSIWV